VSQENELIATAIPDIEKNRLYITLKGEFDVESAQLAIDAIEEGSSKLKPGFTVINDIRSMKIKNLKAAIRIKEGTQAAEKYGAKVTVRVVGRESSAIKVFSYFQKVIGINILVHYTTTLEKAEEILLKEEGK